MKVVWGQKVACSGGSGSCASWKAKETKFSSAAFFPSASEEIKSLLPLCLTVFMMHLPCQDFLESLIRKGHACWFFNLVNVFTHGGAVSGRSQWPSTG